MYGQYMEPPGSLAELSLHCCGFITERALVVTFTALMPLILMDERSVLAGMYAMCVNGCRSPISVNSPACDLPVPRAFKTCVVAARHTIAVIESSLLLITLLSEKWQRLLPGAGILTGTPPEWTNHRERRCEPLRVRVCDSAPAPL